LDVLGVAQESVEAPEGISGGLNRPGRSAGETSHGVAHSGLQTAKEIVRVARARRAASLSQVGIDGLHVTLDLGEIAAHRRRGTAGDAPLENAVQDCGAAAGQLYRVAKV